MIATDWAVFLYRWGWPCPSGEKRGVYVPVAPLHPPGRSPRSGGVRGLGMLPTHPLKEPVVHEPIVARRSPVNMFVVASGPLGGPAAGAERDTGSTPYKKSPRNAGLNYCKFSGRRTGQAPYLFFEG